MTTNDPVEVLPPMPHRRFEVQISIGADSWLDAVLKLESLVDHIREHGHGCSSCSGGGLANHAVTIVEDPAMTRERFDVECSAYAAARRAIAAAEAAPTRSE